MQSVYLFFIFFNILFKNVAFYNIFIINYIIFFIFTYMILYIIILIIFIIIWISYNLFLYTYSKKLDLLEQIIIQRFEKRANLIPSLYQITKNYLNKHDLVFEEIMKLRKIQLNTFWEEFLLHLNNEVKIHSELNFIFKLSNDNQKLQKNYKFLLLKDLFLEQSLKIWEKVKLYRLIIKKFNKLLKYKKFTIIWFFFDIKEKHDI